MPIISTRSPPGRSERSSASYEKSAMPVSRFTCSFSPTTKGWTAFPGNRRSLQPSASKWTICWTSIRIRVISSKYYHEIITTGKDVGQALRLERMPLGDPTPGQTKSPPQTADRFHPVGIRSQDHAPLLHLGDPGLLDLQGRRRAHELGHGQQAGPHPHDAGSAELDRGLRDVCQAVSVYSVVKPVDMSPQKRSDPRI